MTISWMEEMKEKYKTGISNLFLLTGNIGDYAKPGKILLDYLASELVQLKMDKVITYNVAQGSTYIKGERPEKANDIPINDWEQLIQDLQKVDTHPVAYIIEYPEFLVPNPMNGQLDDITKSKLIALHKVINSTEFLQSNHILIFLTEVKSNVNTMFISSNARTFLIEIDYPNEQEREEFVRFLQDTGEVPIDYKIESTQFAKLTAGLSRVNLEDIFI